MNEARKPDYNCADPVPSLLRVAAVQLPRLDPEDRRWLIPHVMKNVEAAR